LPFLQEELSLILLRAFLIHFIAKSQALSNVFENATETRSGLKITESSHIFNLRLDTAGKFDQQSLNALFSILHLAKEFHNPNRI
jgi:hypothetical protein